MAKPLSVTVREIAVDGLPDMDKLTGRVAFIFDGCIVSGWPLVPEQLRREGVYVHPEVEEHSMRGDVLWESNSDVGDRRRKSGVTHWLEFPTPVWNLTVE